MYICFRRNLHDQGAVAYINCTHNLYTHLQDAKTRPPTLKKLCSVSQLTHCLHVLGYIISLKTLPSPTARILTCLES